MDKRFGLKKELQNGSGSLSTIAGAVSWGRVEGQNGTQRDLQSEGKSPFGLVFYESKWL